MVGALALLLAAQAGAPVTFQCQRLAHDGSLEGQAFGVSFRPADGALDRIQFESNAPFRARGWQGRMTNEGYEFFEQHARGSEGGSTQMALVRQSSDSGQFQFTWFLQESGRGFYLTDEGQGRCTLTETSGNPQ